MNEIPMTLLLYSTSRRPDALLESPLQAAFPGAKICTLKTPEALRLHLQWQHCDLLLIDVCDRQTDTMALLESLPGDSLRQPPQIVLLLPTPESKSLRRCRGLGVTRILSKPCTTAVLCRTLRQLLESADAHRAPAFDVDALMRRCRFPANQVGYAYLTEAVTRSNREPLPPLKAVLMQIAENHHVTLPSVQKALAYIIRCSWDSGALQAAFPTMESRPTPRQLIRQLVNALNQED